jgi:cell division septation protein DedD
VTPDHDSDDLDSYEEPAEAAEDSLFSTAWFRALLVFVSMAVIAVVTLPYLLARSTSTVPIAGAIGKSPAGPQPPSPADTRPTPQASSDTRSVAPERAASERAAPVPQPAPSPSASPALEGARGRVAAAPPTRPADTTAPGTKPADGVTKSGEPAKASTGTYWVQVGAFKDVETAKRLAARLRDQNFPVEESPARGVPKAGPAPAPEMSADRYDVVVSGPPAEVNAKIAAKGLASRPRPDGAVITPSLPLREAVALSKELTDSRITVAVRRVGAAPAVAANAGTGLHRVRVGGFSDRAAAVAALRELEAKGYKPFLARDP